MAAVARGVGTPVGAGANGRPTAAISSVIASLRADDQPASAAIAGLAGAPYEIVALPIDRRTIDRLVVLQPDLVVIHTAGGGLDSIRLVRAISAEVDSRILIVTSEQAPDEQVVRVLDAGADDVVVETTSAVLAARVRVALRSHPPTPRFPPRLNVGDVTVDLYAHAVLIGGATVRCPPVQYELLLALAAVPGLTITTEELLRRVWGALPGDVHPRRLRIAVSTMRRVLGSGPSRPTIETVARVGYRLVVPTASEVAQSIGRLESR